MASTDGDMLANQCRLIISLTLHNIYSEYWVNFPQQGCRSILMFLKWPNISKLISLADIYRLPIRTYIFIFTHRSMMFFQFQCAKHHRNPGYRLSVFFSWLSCAIEQRRVTFVLLDALAACRYEALIHSLSMNGYSSPPCALACHRKANACWCFDAKQLRRNKTAFRRISGYFIPLH